MKNFFVWFEFLHHKELESTWDRFFEGRFRIRTNYWYFYIIFLFISFIIKIIFIFFLKLLSPNRLPLKCDRARDHPQIASTFFWTIFRAPAHTACNQKADYEHVPPKLLLELPSDIHDQCRGELQYRRTLDACGRSIRDIQALWAEKRRLYGREKIIFIFFLIRNSIPRRQSLLWKCNNWSTSPKNVHWSCVTVAKWRIKTNVC